MMLRYNVRKREIIVASGKIASLGTLTTDAAGKLDVLRHDGHALGVDGAQVRILEEADQVSLGSLLQRRKFETI